MTAHLLAGMSRLLEGADHIDLTRMLRWQATAQTWFRNAVALMRTSHEAAPNDDVRWLVGYEATKLLRSVLSEAEGLVEVLDAEQVEEVERAAKSLALRLKRARQAAMLANVTGRTPQETAEFERKARDLRG